MSYPKIIIAEDHSNFRRLIVEELRKQQIQVKFEVEDGHELLETVAEEDVDLVLLDLCLTKVDGCECFQIIKKRFPRVKIIIISLWASTALIAHYLAKGAEGFLPKNMLSYDMKNLADGINNVMSGGKCFVDEEKLKQKYTFKQAAIIALICAGKNNHSCPTKFRTISV